MNGLDLFAGSGIGSLALKNIIPDYKTVCYVEWEAYCQAILISRIKDGLLDDAPIWDDVRTFDAKQWRGKVDIVYGGFPCQPFSVAGKRQGEADERNMWPDTIRIIGEVRPRFALLENVPGLLIHKYIRRIKGDMAEIGYDCQWLPLSAAEVGAPHKRERIWILAYPRHLYRGRNVKGDVRLRSGKQAEATIGDAPLSKTTGSSKTSEAVANSISSRQSQCKRTVADKRGRSCNGGEEVADTNSERPRYTSISKERQASGQGYWSVEPSLGRVAHGVAHRVDRLKMLGNGWVIQVLARILQVDSETK